jgi:membrane protein DedA with SNARE-associated domain
VLTTIAAALSSGPQPALPGFLEALASPLQHYGLWGIFALVLIEDFGIPVPGETVIIAGAIYAGSGRLNVVGVGVVAFVAAVIGDNIGYGIGRWGGRRLVDRWRKYVFLTPERLDKAEEFFDRQGAKIITIARFIEGLRQANGIIAGITKMHWLRFLAYNALGAALWVGTWVSIGYFAGQHINTIYGVITRYSLYVAIAAVVLIVALIARHIMRKRRQAVRPARSPGSGGGEAAGGGSGDGEAADAQGAEAAAATDAADGGRDEASAGRRDEASAESGDPGEAGETGANRRSGLSAESSDAAPTNAAHVDADHAGDADDADDGAESGSSGKALEAEASACAVGGAAGPRVSLAFEPSGPPFTAATAVLRLSISSDHSTHLLIGSDHKIGDSSLKSGQNR